MRAVVVVLFVVVSSRALLLLSIVVPAITHYSSFVQLAVARGRTEQPACHCFICNIFSGQCRALEEEEGRRKYLVFNSNLLMIPRPDEHHHDEPPPRPAPDDGCSSTGVGVWGVWGVWYEKSEVLRHIMQLRHMM